MTDAIGGYLGLELRKGEHYHCNALHLNTGRNCFEYILKARGYKHVYIPYYTCEVMTEPLLKLHISYSFYAINEHLEPRTLPVLQANEAFLYTNYFGLKQPIVERLAKHFGSQLIVDNAQAFFAPHIEGIDTFYTARKFFGVPDGAYLYTDMHLDTELLLDESFERMSHLLKRIDINAESGYADYRKHEKALCGQSIKRMSHLTERLLENIDYNEVKTRRIANYKFIQEILHDTNRLALNLDDAIPMVYPYLINRGEEWRRLLQQQQIYTATYWSNVLQWNSPTWEKSLTSNLILLPTDQRYNIQNDNKYLQILVSICNP